MPKRIARRNPARDAWETETTGLFCEHSDVYSETFPSSGMTRSGVAYELPTSAHHTGGTGSSSLLPTPRTSDTNGAGQHGAGGPDLRTVVDLLPTPGVAGGGKKIPEDAIWSGKAAYKPDGTKVQVHLDRIESLLPTPTSRDHKGANQRGDDTCLTGALLPTPNASAIGPHGERGARSLAARKGHQVELQDIIGHMFSGDRTDPQLSDGGESSDD